MSIWVLGSLGMLGSSILSTLLSKRKKVIGTSKKEVDITSLKNIENFVSKRDISHIINCTAYTNVDMAERNPKDAFLVNSEGVKNLAIVSKKIGAKILHFSTDYVFSGDKKSPYSETDITDPSTIYGKSKLLGEQFLLTFAKDPCIMRTSWLFGVNRINFVLNILNLLKNESRIKVVSDQIGKPTFCEDLALAAIDFLSSDGIYHFANDSILSRYDYALLIYDTIKKISKDFPYFKDKKIIPVKTEKSDRNFAPRPLYSVLDTQKVEKKLKRKIPSLGPGLEKYLSKMVLENKFL